MVAGRRRNHIDAPASSEPEVDVSMRRRTARWIVPAGALALGVGLAFGPGRRVHLERRWSDDWIALCATDAPACAPGTQFTFARRDVDAAATVVLECVAAGLGSVHVATRSTDEGSAAGADDVAVIPWPPVLNQLPAIFALAGAGARVKARPVGDDLVELATPLGTRSCGRVRFGVVDREAGYLHVDVWWSPELPVPVRIWRRPADLELDEPPAAAPLPPGGLLVELVGAAHGEARPQEGLEPGGSGR